MPLKSGKKNIGKNIRELESSGRSKAQALAIALSKAYGKTTSDERAKKPAPKLKNPDKDVDTTIVKPDKFDTDPPPEDAHRRGIPWRDHWSDNDTVELSKEGRDEALSRSTDVGLDMTLDEKVAKMQEAGGPRKSANGQPGTSGQGSFGRSESEKRRLEDNENVKTLRRVKAQALRQALEQASRKP